MASRRDELNAYTFARKRTVGAFLRPEGGGNDEDAPRPIRAVVPSLVVGAVALAGFGLWGMIKPGAPVGWDDGKSVIVGKDSTTRYVLLPNPDGTKSLHPVVNMASAKLVLPADSKVVFVADSVLDHYKAHGPTIGIPYAPDKLPGAAEAAKPKKWSVCDRPGSDPDHPYQSLFLAADADAATLARPDRELGGSQSLFVRGPKQDGQAVGTSYLVDPTGASHQIGTDDQVKAQTGKGGAGDTAVKALQVGLFGNQAAPEQVSKEWLDTLLPGAPIAFPKVPGTVGQQSTVQLPDSSQRVVGRLLTSEQGDADFVVGPDRLYQVTPFQAQLIQMDPATQPAYPQGQAPSLATLTPAALIQLGDRIDSTTMAPPLTKSAQDTQLPPGAWPRLKPALPANSGDQGTARPVVCSTFEGGFDGTLPQRSVWAGTDYPAPVIATTNAAHVSAGHGLFYRAMDNTTQGSGSNYLITETGLRYSVPASSEGAPSGQASPSAAPSQPAQPAQPQVNEAQARLGYKDDVPVPVPKAWSDLVPAGPALNTNAATQEQNS
ncbi:type VII secretion protein EccB [Kitasatospora sp. NPDC006697]|uniref:type VII secretion protein EccB n=1 Tax=Kitasatospora sp. NPDC006697 TaxID=3364020 RepID=UPI0036A02268